MAVVSLTTENFKAEVLDSAVPVLIDFYADWCPPCRIVSPIVDEISEERTDVKVCKVNVDDEPELGAQFGIENIPTLIVIRDGKQTAKNIGAVPKDAILAMFS